MPNYIEIPTLCPLNVVSVNRSLSPSYHFKHFDEWKSSEQILPYYSAFDYKQKWQKNDIITLTAKSNFGPVRVDIYNEYQDLIGSANMAVIGVVGDNAYWLLNLNISALDGCYVIKIIAGEGEAEIALESEEIFIKEDHPGTLLYKFWNNYNNTVYWEGVPYMTIRLEGEIKQYETGGIRRVYIDQPNTSKTVRGVSSRAFKLFSGSSIGMPDVYADKLQEIFDQTNVEIDGKGFSALTSASKLTPERADLYSFAGWSMDIAETVNRRAKRFESSGIIEKKVVIDYIAVSKLFGPIKGNAEDTTYYIKNLG